MTVAFPDKPKRMHWRTYNRLRRVHDHAAARSLMALTEQFARLNDD